MSRVEGQGSRWIHRPTRLAIYARDGFRCVYCTRKVQTARGKGLGWQKWAAQLDHVLAQELGGRSTPDNLVTSCAPCNHLKASRPASVFARDLKLFRRSDWRPGLAARIRAALSTPLDRAEGRRLHRAGH